MCLSGWVRAFFEPDLMKGTFQKTSWVLMAGTVYERRHDKRQLT